MSTQHQPNAAMQETLDSESKDKWCPFRPFKRNVYGEFYPDSLCFGRGCMAWNSGVCMMMRRPIAELGMTNNEFIE